MRALLLALAALALLPAAAGAARIYAVDGDEIVSFDSTDPSVALSAEPLTGIGAGESVRGLEWRDATSRFILLTATAGGQGTLYDLDPLTGIASEARSLSALLTGTAFGVDMNADTDILRIVSASDQNIAVDPDTGLVTTETAINPTGNQIAAIASEPGEVALFDYGFVSDKLYAQDPPQSGTITEVGQSVIPAAESATFVHMDIAPDGSAFVSLRNGGAQKLLAMNLATGFGTVIGQTGTALGMTAVNNVASVAAPEVHVGESAGEVDILFERAAAFDSATVSAVAGASTANGTATAPHDYSPTATYVPFPAGSATAALTLQIPDDTVDEADETFTVNLSTALGTPVAEPLVTTVTIHDDDAPPVTETRTETVTQVETRTVIEQPPPIVLLPGRCANTRNGTADDDALAGTTSGDRLNGLGGADGLSGLAGDDCLSGGAGDDLVSGGAGDDELAGNGGSNRINGGPGADTVNSRNRKRDVVDCGPGRDTITADRRDRLRRCERVTRRR